MKRAFFAVMLLCGIFSSNAAVMVSSDPTPATMNEHFVITLPVDQPLAAVYVVDITTLGFKSQDQLNEFCKNASERVMIMRGNFEEKKLFVSPQPEMNETPWAVADWNSYLANRAGKLEALYQMVIAE